MTNKTIIFQTALISVLLLGVLLLPLQSYAQDPQTQAPEFEALIIDSTTAEGESPYGILLDVPEDISQTEVNLNEVGLELSGGALMLWRGDVFADVEQLEQQLSEQGVGAISQRRPANWSIDLTRGVIKVRLRTPEPAPLPSGAQPKRLARQQTSTTSVLLVAGMRLNFDREKLENGENPFSMEPIPFEEGFDVFGMAGAIGAELPSNRFLTANQIKLLIASQPLLDLVSDNLADVETTAYLLLDSTSTDTNDFTFSDSSAQDETTPPHLLEFLIQVAGVSPQEIGELAASDPAISQVLMNNLILEAGATTALATLSQERADTLPLYEGLLANDPRAVDILLTVAADNPELTAQVAERMQTSPTLASAILERLTASIGAQVLTVGLAETSPLIAQLTLQLAVLNPDLALPLLMEVIYLTPETQQTLVNEVSQNPASLATLTTLFTENDEFTQFMVALASSPNLVGASALLTQMISMDELAAEQLVAVVLADVETNLRLALAMVLSPDLLEAVVLAAANENVELAPGMLEAVLSGNLEFGVQLALVVGSDPVLARQFVGVMLANPTLTMELIALAGLDPAITGFMADLAAEYPEFAAQLTALAANDPVIAAQLAEMGVTSPITVLTVAVAPSTETTTTTTTTTATTTETAPAEPPPADPAPVVDSDGDGFEDLIDACPAVFGTVNGCPDGDGDGFEDLIDMCPATFGTVNGCPDGDGDGFHDGVDFCPAVFGTVNGCPDGDGDGFHDAVDFCPAVFGTVNGCPDGDGDGFEDLIDMCPATFGTVNGCPDGDGDGLHDAVDMCPAAFGPFIQNGCPDTDLDTFHDGVDMCPATFGTVNGCPDTDTDGFHDGIDNCPTIFNPSQENVDPDAGGDWCDPVIDAPITADAIVSGPNITVINGNAGNDTISAMSTGNDTLNGGADFDTATYSTMANPLTVNVAGGGGATASGLDIGTDTLNSIEAIIGGANSDLFMVTGAGGAGVGDSYVLDGGGGTNTFSIINNALSGYWTFNNVTQLNLVNVGGTGATFDFSNTTTHQNIFGSAWLLIQNAVMTVTATDQADNLTTHSGGMVVEGNNGNDTITGGSGVDQIYGGGGSDVINAGVGADIVYGGWLNPSGFNRSDGGSDTITDNDADVDVINGGNLNEAGGRGDDGGDVFILSNAAAPNTIYGGNDNLVGSNCGVGTPCNDGNDTFSISGTQATLIGGNYNLSGAYGHDGNDVVSVSAGGSVSDLYAGNNNLTGGRGTDGGDTLTFTAGSGFGVIHGGNNNVGGCPNPDCNDGADSITDATGAIEMIYGGNNNNGTSSGNDTGGADTIDSNDAINDIIYTGNENLGGTGVDVNGGTVIGDVADGTDN